jgi:hypothetical protein
VQPAYIAQVDITDPNGSALTTGNGKAYFRVNSILNGRALTAVAMAATTASSSGLPTFQIYNVRGAYNMLSTALSLDATETDSSTAATAAVIDTASSHNIVNTADQLRFDCSVAGTGTKGIMIELTFS